MLNGGFNAVGGVNPRVLLVLTQSWRRVCSRMPNSASSSENINSPAIPSPRPSCSNPSPIFFRSARILRALNTLSMPALSSSPAIEQVLDVGHVLLQVPDISFHPIHPAGHRGNQLQGLSLYLCEFSNGPCECSYGPCEFSNRPCEFSNRPCECSNRPFECSNPPFEFSDRPFECSNPPFECSNPPFECSNGPCEFSNRPFEFPNGPCEFSNRPCEFSDFSCEDIQPVHGVLLSGQGTVPRCRSGRASDRHARREKV